MKKILVLSIFLLSYCFAHSSSPLSIKQILETPLPPIWASVEEVYIWEKNDFKEYKIKRARSSEPLTKFAKESALCNYIFDVEGNRTKKFLTYFVGSDWSTKKIHINQNEEKDVYYITLWEETVGDLEQFVPRKAGNIKASLTHKLGEKDKIAKPTFYYYSGKISQTFFGEMEEYKRYRITFNKNKTKVFLHESKYFE